MWIAWVIFAVAGVAAGFVYSRMRGDIRLLGPNYFDLRPRFRRVDVEHVRAALTHRHNQLLPHHQQVTALDTWLAPLCTVTAVAGAFALTDGRPAGWLPIAFAIAAGLGDQAENFLIRRILAAPTRPVPHTEVRWLAVGTTVKFVGYGVAIVLSVILAFQR